MDGWMDGWVDDIRLLVVMITFFYVCVCVCILVRERESACTHICVFHTVGISDHATAGRLRGLFLHLYITIFFFCTISTAEKKWENSLQWSQHVCVW